MGNLDSNIPAELRIPLAGMQLRIAILAKREQDGERTARHEKRLLMQVENLIRNRLAGLAIKVVASVNINTASPQDLGARLRGIGPKACEAIVESRPFANLEELRAKLDKKFCNKVEALVKGMSVRFEGEVFDEGEGSIRENTVDDVRKLALPSKVADRVKQLKQLPDVFEARKMILSGKKMEQSGIGADFDTNFASCRINLRTGHILALVPCNNHGCKCMKNSHLEGNAAKNQGASPDQKKMFEAFNEVMERNLTDLVTPGAIKGGDKQNVASMRKLYSQTVADAMRSIGHDWAGELVQNIHQMGAAINDSGHSLEQREKWLTDTNKYLLRDYNECEQSEKVKGIAHVTYETLLVSIAGIVNVKTLTLALKPESMSQLNHRIIGNTDEIETRFSLTLGSFGTHLTKDDMNRKNRTISEEHRKKELGEQQLGYALPLSGTKIGIETYDEGLDDFNGPAREVQPGKYKKSKKPRDVTKNAGVHRGSHGVRQHHSGDTSRMQAEPMSTDITRWGKLA